LERPASVSIEKAPSGLSFGFPPELEEVSQQGKRMSLYLTPSGLRRHSRTNTSMTIPMEVLSGSKQERLWRSWSKLNLPDV
jgi:hypothetical protein